MDTPAHAGPSRLASGLALFLPPALTAAVVWWIIGAALAWLDRHSGEISAWFIATFDIADVTGLLAAVRYLAEWIRRIVVPFAALVWFAELLRHGWGPWLDRRSLARAFSPTRLIAVTIVAALTLWAPLAYGLYWMPDGLPASWVEPAVAALKFGAMALVAAIGLSLIARLAVTRTGG
ncbi:MAG: hypothetical protein R2712_11450 [Vicinamibacterales bacterium]